MRHIFFKFRRRGEVIAADLVIARKTVWRNSEESTQDRWSVCIIGRLVFALCLPDLPDTSASGSGKTARRAPLGADRHVDRNSPQWKRLI
jgi:hypothetical protein